MRIKNILSTDSRSKVVGTQIILSFVFRGLSIGLNLFVIPATLSLLTSEKYGIWITLQSVFSWITLFDIGIGNGLRNKLTIALANNDFNEAKKYISTAYFIISLIGIIMICGVLLSVGFVNWESVFKSSSLRNIDYQKLIKVSIISLIVCFVLGLINQIFNAFQKNSYSNLISIIANILFIILIFVFRSKFQGDLLMVATSYCSCLIFSNFLISTVFFIYNKTVFPSIKHIQKEKIGDILKLGGSFFLIQIAVLLIFSIDNFLILQLLGPSAVTEYNIVYRLFSIFTIGFGILMGPLWSAFTEAHVNNDVIWIKKIIKNLIMSLIPVVVALVVVILLLNTILKLWLPANRLFVPEYSLVISMAFFVFISLWNNIFAYYLNGISETKIQVRTALIGAVINVPLAIFLVKFLHWGLTGIILSMIASLFLFSIIGPIITYRNLNTKLS